MRKVFDDPDIFDEDDMPCRCDCGNWFDLFDGYSSIDPDREGVVVCEKCHEYELEEFGD